MPSTYLDEIHSHLEWVKTLSETELLISSIPEEEPAVLTHFMQNPTSKPPLMSEEAHSKLLKLYRKGDFKLFNSGDHLVREPSFAYLPSVRHAIAGIPFPPPETGEFDFVDLFAGIGGFRIAFQDTGGKCVFSSEWDKYAQRTYAWNFGEFPYGDIRRIPKEEIPDHDVLCAGFPCQPFSLAGVSKKNSLGRKHGFEDETQGTLFFVIKEILRIKRPKAFMLENVKNLQSHDNHRTFEVIRQALEDYLGYVVSWKIVDGAAWVPQHRERIFIVGYDPRQISISKDEILIPDGPEKGYDYPELNSIICDSVEGYTLGLGTWETLERHKAHHAAMGNGFGYGLHRLPIPEGAVTRTISARYHKDGAEALIEQKGSRPRKLTIKEAMQLQGYDPKKFTFPVSRTQAYKQIGNSVVVPAIRDTANEIAKILKDKKRWV